MADEQLILDSLQKTFALPADAGRVARERRIFAQLPIAQLRPALEHLRAQHDFTQLCSITGLDDGENFALIYHLARSDGTVLNLRTSVPRGAPAVASVHELYHCALLYERELVDLFGIEVSGLPPGARYPLPDDWPANEHPLRKDWTPAAAATAAPEAEKSHVDG